MICKSLTLNILFTYIDRESRHLKKGPHLQKALISGFLCNSSPLTAKIR